MYYKCKKCNLVWKHKVGFCIHCNSKLVKINPKKQKLLEKIQVNIPSLMHPKVPYYVSVLADEAGIIEFKKVIS